MLLSYGARNFFCFKEGAQISFEFGAQCPVEVFNGKSVSNILCVKGANASGKTNALKILSFLSFFITNSFSSKPEEEIPFETFFFESGESEFFVDFEVEDIMYRYELIANVKRVLSEKIYRKKDRLTLVVERKNESTPKCIGEFKELRNIKKLRANVSIVSLAHQYEVDCIEPLYNFFNNMISNVVYSGLNDNRPDLSSISEHYKNHDNHLEFAKNLISKFDLGVNNIEIGVKKDEKGKDDFFPVFNHLVEGEENALTFHSESSGTKSLFTQLCKYKYTLDIGGTLILDEFDINLHPDILPKLIDLFLNKKTNSENAQLIFTTHNVDVMDILGKYRTIIVAKDDNESYVYRLDEIPGELLRNDRSIIPIYKSGKIGGVPKFD